MATPAPAALPNVGNVLGFLHSLNPQTLEAELKKIEADIPFALMFLPSSVKQNIQWVATLVIGLCLALGGTVPGQSSAPPTP